jgi:hypothetical protein
MKIPVGSLGYRSDVGLDICSDVIPGLEEKELGNAAPRDPDALPPSTALELVGGWIHDFLASLRGGNAIFGLKAGVLSGAVFHTEVAMLLKRYQYY